MKCPCKRTALKERQGSKNVVTGCLYLDLIMALTAHEKKLDIKIPKMLLKIISKMYSANLTLSFILEV